MSTSFQTYCNRFFKSFFENSLSKHTEATKDSEVINALLEQYAFESVSNMIDIYV